MEHNKKMKLCQGNYDVCIDSSFKNGHMMLAELILPGASKKEILITTYICHPSMANNELSGISVVTALANWLSNQKKRKYTYRIVFAPETIGNLAHIKKNFSKLKKNVIAGFNLTCIGDERSYSYLQSRDGNTLADKVSMHVMKWIDKKYKKYDWRDRGSSERQYCSPHLNLPLVTLMRTKFAKYPEYHTSDDRLGTVVTKKGLLESFEMVKKILIALENNHHPIAKFVGEPYLAKRNLYPQLSFGNGLNTNNFIKNMCNLLSYSDGKNSLIDIADKLNIPIWNLYEVYDTLIKHKLIK